jgi:aryl-alcohol dehydrogenase-like predicted oxidoreductase
MQQLKDNIESIQIKLTPEILKEINAIHEEIPNPSC